MWNLYVDRMQLSKMAKPQLLSATRCLSNLSSGWLIAIWLILSLILVAPATSTFAQVDDTPSEERLEEEGEEEEDDFDDEEDEEEGELGELFEIREYLQERLERQKDAVNETKRQMEVIDDFLALLKQVGQLEDKIEAAEEAGDKALLEKLEEQGQRLETEIELRGELLEVEGELMEIRETLEEAERDDDEDRIELLETLVEGFERIREISLELIPIYLDGPESKEGPLEQEKDRLYTNKIEKPFRALEILEELEEAEDEEDEALIEELEEKLDELRAAMDAQSEDDKEQTEKVSVAKPALLPVLVNDETLAPFANADLKKDVAPLLQQYCIDCHGNDSSSGELNLEKLLATSPIVKERDRWINVIEQSKNHVMPPEDAEQPTLEERKTIVLALHNAVHNFDYSHIKNPGYESTRRMTHREYSNTVRDLFGIEIDVIDRFPDDLTATSGFDNSSNSLFIQPLLMERYVGIAEHVVTTALPNNPATPKLRAVRDKIFVSQPATDDDVEAAARTVFTQFLTRAYRRPATAKEIDRFTNQVTKAVSNGVSYELAVKATLQTVLITPSFLLLSERDHPTQSSAFQVSDWELASRLSYFIWASMPDEELTKAAAEKTLHEPKMLQAQVQRMLSDPKAESLGSVFASQWLGSHHLGVRMRMDPIDNPWCTETLMAAMREETSMFFNEIVQNNRPIPELIDADYTFLNEELAKLYRIKGIEGDNMRRVSLTTKDRGGIFGQGSLLAITSFPYRTSPVVRGKWILDNVLGTPPPPPPPNVSELSEDIEENGRLSFREKLELHREKPNCYACHSQMDPLGFSLEQYDWFGRYRSRQGRKRIDATGQLPNGTEFDGLAGLKKIIVEQRRDDLVRQVSKKMLSYALGRQLEYYDEPTIRKIVANVTEDGDRMQTLIREIVMSYAFQYKQNSSSENVAASN